MSEKLRKHVIVTYDVTDLKGGYVVDLIETVRTVATRYGVTATIKRWNEQPPPLPEKCPCCNKEVVDENDHWVDDGPNRSGWGCP